jgi:GH25 family lysozyme M1 (1,4-beta-N-acetylmuramidase)
MKLDLDYEFPYLIHGKHIDSKKKKNKHKHKHKQIKQGTYRYGTPGAPDAFNASRYELKELKKKKY